MMKCSLIIPAYNSENTIKLTLNSILNQRVKPDEIIIVYATSNDDTFKIIKNFIDVLGITVIETNPLGPAKSRNVGIKYANNEILIFVDADCILPVDYIEKYMFQFANKDIFAAACKIRGYLPKSVIEYYLSEYGLALPDRETVFESPEFLKTFVHTASFACRKEIFNKIGVFDEKLLTGEDHDFSYRLLKANYSIHYFTGLYILHKFNSNFFRFIKQTYSFSVVHSTLIRKHFKINPHIYFKNKKYIINYIKIPLIVNLNNLTFKLGILCILLFVNEWFAILLFLWLIKLFISLNRRFTKKYKLSKISVIFLLFLHLIYNFVSLIGEIAGVFKKH